MAEETLESLQSKKNGLLKAYEDAKAQNAKLCAEIDRYSEALAAVGEAKSRIDAVKGKVKRIDPDDRWRGKRRDGFDNGKDHIASGAEKGSDAMMGFSTELALKIADKGKEVNWVVAAMSRAEEGINEVGKAIGDLIDGE